ncbi:hypothetical protein BDM02DRAFT_3181176 [Thelephora ganbajun]|uniref:Uncharacterized protein n=1 Tax=Thelephora ganbajun TaxID=370292 RepID=A0ACB6Z8E1_THEGA|nr:hypothetical protein BDM02DRAFT_3181176 [Thelephora ganbajun]
MWWYKIPVLLAVATTNQVSLSDWKVTELQSRSPFVAYSLFAFRGFFWTLTACEVALIWSASHLSSPVAHRILGTIVHPWANFPPKPRISLPFTIGWSIAIISLVIHLLLGRYYRSNRQSSISLGQVSHVSRKRIQDTRRAVRDSNPVMAIGSTSCYILPGSFAYECWVWRMRFGGTFFCLMGVSYVVFWLAVVAWRCVRSRRGSGAISEPVEGVASSDTDLEEDSEDTIDVLIVERFD